jgi:hypothetical protein
MIRTRIAAITWTVVEPLLADLRRAHDQTLRDTDPLMLEALREILAHIDRELTALTVEVQSGEADADTVFQRISALTQAVDRCVSAH